MGYLINGIKTECFGCGACAQICTHNAIEMIPDEAGFLYPKIKKENCVSCGVCEKVCPREKNLNFNEPMQAFAGFCKNASIRKKSASGGAFYAITKSVPENSNIFGVDWSDRSNAAHFGAVAKEAYELFHKSKYVQSNTGDVYKEIREQLKKDLYVVFTGTPCQVAGLKAYLGKEYEKLLCVDLVCHGVPSGKILEAYLRDVERPNDKIQKIEFRHKDCKKQKWESKYAKLIYESGKEKIVDYDSSAFLRGFANGLFFRDSCGECMFAQKERISDLTIGDCWGVDRELPYLDPHQGVSLVLVNTARGKRFMESMKDHMELYSINIETAVLGNARLRNPDKGHKYRLEFLENMDKIRFEKLVQKYVPSVPKLKKIASYVKKKILGRK